MKCDCCGNEIKTDFVWHNIPALAGGLQNVCEECAKKLLASFLEENSPEYTRVNPQDYNMVLDRFSKLDSKGE